MYNIYNCSSNVNDSQTGNNPQIGQQMIPSENEEWFGVVPPVFTDIVLILRTDKIISTFLTESSKEVALLYQTSENLLSFDVLCAHGWFFTWLSREHRKDQIHLQIKVLAKSDLIISPCNRILKKKPTL